MDTPRHTLYRASDPDTSRESAYSIDVNRLEGLVLDVIRSYGIMGCISEQVREQLHDLPYSSVTARFKALKEKGLIEDTGERRKGSGTRSQAVLRITGEKI